MNLPQTSPVIIVGAGPSGLMMAAQLLRNGIHPLIIDSKTSPSNHSKALAIQARSLEIFKQLGVVEQFLEKGNIARQLALQQGPHELAKLNFDDLGKDRTPFPYVFILEQSTTERILLDFLTTNACPVFWNTELIELSQSAYQVTVKVKRENEVFALTSPWVIGADGAHSKVRKSLGIEFSGGTYQHQFYLADLNLTKPFPQDAIRIILKSKGFVGFFPLRDNKFRLIGLLPEKLKNKADVEFEDIRTDLPDIFNSSFSDYKCSWFATYKLHHRMTAKFKQERCFLIGDSAHVHSPIGGQGMNTGLQDAYNLGWKLAGVIKDEFSVKILSSFADERMPVAKTLLKTTDRLFSLAVAQNRIVQIFRNWIAPLMIKWVWKDDKLSKRLFTLVSQTGINYRQSNLSVHHSLATKIKAGDRLPYIRLYDEKLKEETDLHGWCSKTGFTLLVIGKLSKRDVLALAKWIKQSYRFTLNFYYLPPSPKNQAVFDCFEIAENRKKAVIVRPDMHIGYINDIVDIDLIDGYFKEVLG